MIDRPCQDQNGHKDFEVREGPKPGFFQVVSRSEAISFSVCLAWYTYVQYLMAEKKELPELQRLAKVALPLFSVMVGHRYQQHGGCAYCGSHTLQFHTYLIYSSYVLKDAAALAYASIDVVVKQRTTDFGKNGAKQDVDRSSRTLKNDRASNNAQYDEEESKDEGSTAGGTKFANARNWKHTAGIIPKE